MFESLLCVKYLTSHNCICLLSSRNLERLESNAVKLFYNDNKTQYVTVGPPPGNYDDNTIGISSKYAKLLGIEESSLVAVTGLPKLPTISTVQLKASDDVDYYVLESLADKAQSTILDQIRVLSKGQKFMIWLGKHLTVTLIICDIRPISPGLIDNLTTVIIKPPEKEKELTNDEKINKQMEETFVDPVQWEITINSLELRVASFNNLSKQIEKFYNPFNVFIFKSACQQTLTVNDTLALPQIFLMEFLSPDHRNSVYVRLFLFEDFLPGFKLQKVCSDSVFISDTLMDYLKCDTGSRVKLIPFYETLPDVRAIEICTKKNYSIDIVETFQQYLADNCREHEFVLSSEVVIDAGNNLRCFVKFQPRDLGFCFVTPDFLRNCKFVVVNATLPERERLEKREFLLDRFITQVGNYEEIIDRSLFLFSYNLESFRKMHNVLITGKSGTGKSTLLDIISHNLNSFPLFIYTERFNCKSLKGKKIDSLRKTFNDVIVKLLHHQPSVLILDDLHVLCENVNEGDALAQQQAIFFNRTSEMLEGLFRDYCEHNAVGILATSESTSKLNKNIYATRGNHLFKHVFSIKQLERNDRLNVLEFLFSSCELDNVDLGKLATKTESFVIRDMVDLVYKTQFESYQEDADQATIKISSRHSEKALILVTEISIPGVSLQPPGDKTLDDIGGLAAAKQIITQTMLWPAKYPELFANAPLRLPSGLLLYGPPGTGKTLLAGAAARHCGLRLISIKGPELLSKYIGASEQAVRDVFQRAQSAKPCILFFDEFDSLAPRRGHDNTGVTDRVVNQLLTQLDGIESLSGVFVLAATSRPDLLDPALLRPGRLDIHIRCDMPDENARLEILEALSEFLPLADDVSFEDVAHDTVGFSGADLQAVLYSAQLESAKDLLEDEEKVEEFDSWINQKHLLEGLRVTRPSLTWTELKKYEQYYRNFEGCEKGDFTPGSRATLA